MSEQSKSENVTFPPEKLIIPHDDHHCKYVGIAESGEKFFITTPFTWEGQNEESKEFVACYIFDQAGDLKKAIIDHVGTRASIIGKHNATILRGMTIMDNQTTDDLIQEHLASLGNFELKNISVAPFSIKKHDLEFGLIPIYPEDINDEGSVIILPGNYIAFYSPWDGDYCT